MYEIHWWALEEMIKNGSAKNCYLRYNSNLSRVEYYGKNLYDYLPQFKDWMMCASVPEPKPASAQYVDNGVTKTKVDDKNPEYLKAVDDVALQRNARLVMASLIKGGNFPELADSDDTVKEEYALNNLDSDLFYGVLSALVQLRTRLQVTVNAVKDSF